MEDYLLLNKMRGDKSYDSHTNRELMSKFREFMAREQSMEEPYYSDYRYKKEPSARHFYRETKLGNEHFSPIEAEQIVSEMYHYDGSKKHVGEKYSIMKAKEVCERYRGMIPSHINYIDVYVAINAQYHDYSNLFKSWFGDNIDSKIIESAVIFWFRDDDFREENKLQAYFNM